MCQQEVEPGRKSPEQLASLPVTPSSRKIPIRDLRHWVKGHSYIFCLYGYPDGTLKEGSGQEFHPPFPRAHKSTCPLPPQFLLLKAALCPCDEPCLPETPLRRFYESLREPTSKPKSHGFIPPMAAELSLLARYIERSCWLTKHLATSVFVFRECQRF